jgi:hypothetical protein
VVLLLLLALPPGRQHLAHLAVSLVAQRHIQPADAHAQLVHSADLCGTGDGNARRVQGGGTGGQSADMHRGCCATVWSAS